jgi:hypothetical protein
MRSRKAIVEPTDGRKKGRTVESPLVVLREWALKLSRAPEEFSDFDGLEKKSGKCLHRRYDVCMITTKKENQNFDHAQSFQDDVGNGGRLFALNSRR